jgi:glycosyltransferase involved in cell wall biosynthesis
LIYVARFVEQKNHCFLIEVLSQLPDTVTLTLVGDGPLRQRVVSWAREAGVGHRLRFTGLIPREEVYNELRSADVFVSTSVWEGLPIAVLEAMALRRPVVLSDIGPHREIAELGAEVKIVPLRVPEWRDVIEHWASLASEELARIGERNRRTVEAALSLGHMHDASSEIYQQLTP